MLALLRRVLKSLEKRSVDRQASVSLAEVKLSPLEASLVTSIPDLLILMARDGSYRALNTGEGVRVLHPTQAFAYPANVRDVLPPEKARERLAFVERALQTGQLQQYDYSLQVDGELRHEEARISVCGPDTVLVTIRDITAKKQAEFLLQLRTRQERILYQISQQIRQSLRLEDVLNTSVLEIRLWLKVDRVVVYRVNSDASGDIIVESVSAPQFSILGRTICDPCFGKAEVETYRQGRISFHEDIYADNLQPCHIELLEQFQIRANLVVPILYENKVWGLLIAHHCSGTRSWHAWELDLLRQIAAQLSIAIQQAELYQQLQRANTELDQVVQIRTRQLQEALKHEELLRRITQNIRESLDESHLFAVAAQLLGEGLHLCQVSIHVLDDERSSTLAFRFSLVPESKYDPIAEVAWSLDTLMDQLEGGQVIHCCLLEPVDWFPERNHTLLICPIADNEVLLGALAVAQTDLDPFGDTEIQLVQQVAAQCAIAIRQARLYEAAQAQVKELEKLNQLKDDFVATVSHELRTPMTNIKIATKMLQITFGSPEKQDHYLKTLERECEREISLINDLLDLQRLETGSKTVSLEAIDLQPWLETLVDSFQDRARQRLQRIVLDVDPHLDILYTDRVTLDRVLVELLTNACKYTPPHHQIAIKAHPFGSVSSPSFLLDPLVSQSGSALSEGVELQIINTGVEIPADHLPRLFQKFYRIPKTDRWQQGGTGLGLALVKRSVEWLEGEIWVSSGSEQTTFTIRLPHSLVSSPSDSSVQRSETSVPLRR